MARQAGQLDVENVQLQRCVEGDTSALVVLQRHYHPILRAMLIGRGASETEAEDLLADLWGDCVPRHDDGASLLEKFSGKCALKTWLITVAVNRLYDFKRKEVLPQRSPLEFSASSGNSLGTGGLVDLLRCCLEEAFARCAAQDLLILRLVYLHAVTQREVGRMWGWHESKVSRRMAVAMGAIRDETLRSLRKTDPWLELTWQDFVELCQTHQLGPV